jgi:signal peptidase complex subunit 1
MDAIISQLQDLLEGQIDFDGQRLAERTSTAILTLSSVVAFIVGFIHQDIYLIMWIGLAGTALAMLLVVPPWPIYNKHPQPWLGSKAALPPGGIVVGGNAR